MVPGDSRGCSLARFDECGPGLTKIPDIPQRTRPSEAILKVITGNYLFLLFWRVQSAWPSSNITKFPHLIFSWFIYWCIYDIFIYSCYAFSVRRNKNKQPGSSGVREPVVVLIWADLLDVRCRFLLHWYDLFSGGACPFRHFPPITMHIPRGPSLAPPHPLPLAEWFQLSVTEPCLHPTCIFFILV